MSQQKQYTNAAARPEAAAETQTVSTANPTEAPQEARENAPGQAEPALLESATVAALQTEVEQALTKAEENWNLYLTARAEMDNLRKRNERELQNAHKFALKDFIEALLPVKDSLELGITAASDVVDANKLREGSELTLKLLAGVLEKFDVQEINPVGAKFNPDLHQAMAMQPSEQAEPNTVLQVVQKGYTLNERLIRPAMVIVAQAVKKADSGIENP